MYPNSTIKRECFPIFRKINRILLFDLLATSLAESFLSMFFLTCFLVERPIITRNVHIVKYL